MIWRSTLKKTFKGGLGVMDCRFTFETHSCQRLLWIPKLNWVTIVMFTKHKVIKSVNFYLIVHLFIMGLIASSYETILFHWYPRSLYLVSFIFLHLHDIDDCLFNLRLP